MSLVMLGSLHLRQLVMLLPGKAPIEGALFDLLAMFGGLAIGLLGLVWYETKHMKKLSKNNNTHMQSLSSYSTYGEITLQVIVA